MKGIVIGFSAVMVLFFFGTAFASEHPPIVLMDHEGNEISLDSQVPYSPKQTCGECHDHGSIAHSFVAQTDSGVSIRFIS